MLHVSYNDNVFFHLNQPKIRDLHKNEVDKIFPAPYPVFASGIADTSCGNACLAHVPEGASGFMTIELKSNHLGTAREGAILCTATLQHAGRTTQVWDALVTDEKTGKKIAMFRCTQMILWPKR